MVPYATGLTEQLYNIILYTLIAKNGSTVYAMEGGHTA